MESSVAVNDGLHEKSSPEPLCGFLTKLSSGIIKSSKSRWFLFQPETCELVYYRAKNVDVNDFEGKISLRRASFNFSAADLKENIFKISADGTMHILQACDRNALVWWLEGLQEQRRLFNINRDSTTSDNDEWPGCLLGQSIFWIPNNTNINPGLLNIGPENANSLVTDSGVGLSVSPEVLYQYDAKNGKSRSVSLLSSSIGSKLSKFGSINNVLSSAGEALKFHANKLLPSYTGRRHSDCDTEPREALQKDVPAFASTGNLSPVKGSNCNSMVAYYKGKIAEMQLEIELHKTKLQSKEEVVQRLMQELEKYEAIKENERTFSKDDYKLRSELIGIKLDKERLEQEKKDAEIRENRLKAEISMFAETVAAKDELVRDLSLRVDELERKHEALQSEHVRLRAEKNEEFLLIPTEAEESITELKDRAEGYMMQNKLLNTEITELAQLRQNDARKMQFYLDKVQQGEAEYLRLHSKYLILLSEMNKPAGDNVGLVVAEGHSTDDDQRQEMLKILISDALKDANPASDESASHHASDRQPRTRKYDQFGFDNLPDDDTDAMLVAAASQLEKRSADITQSLSKFNTSVAIKWQNYLAINKELQRCDEVKNLIRLGVPHELRPQVWKWMVQVLTAPIRQKLDTGRSYYKELEGSRGAQQLLSKQIELDLLRTLPNNKHFSSLSSFGTQQLRRVLHAFSIHNPSIGYCQGLNRIAAVALLYLSEEEAFWCLVAIVECIMPPDYYSTTLTASQADQRVFRDLMAEKLPRLHRHLDAAGVDTSLITFNWLLCVYCDNVPPETMLHIWDCFLYEGSKVLFRFGLAFFKHVEEEILQLSDYISIFNFMRMMSHRMHDNRELTQVAFAWMNPFPMRKIARLRQIHMEKVAMELQELDILRRGFQSNRDDRRRDLDSDED